MPPSAQIVIQKFGGSSLATLSQVCRAAETVGHAYRAGNPVVVVVSARGTTTDSQLALVSSISPAPDRREVDQLLATGEAASAAVLALTLRQQDVPAISLTAAQAGIHASGNHSAGTITKIDRERIMALLSAGYVPVVAGFQGINQNGDIVTLGRGGSDTTAVALAAALGQRECTIYTNVDGVHDTDPGITGAARPLAEVNGDVLTEMSFAGAKVVHARAAELAAVNGVDLRVSSSSGNGTGTIVHNGDGYRPEAAYGPVTVLADHNVALVTVCAVSAEDDLAAEVFTRLGENAVTVDGLTQSPVLGNGARIVFTIPAALADPARAALAPVAGRHRCEVHVDAEVAKVSVVGNGLLTRAGYMPRILAALAGGNVRVALAYASQIRISTIVPVDEAIRAVLILHGNLILRGTSMV